ncbi:MAG: hypothetical protein HUJ51_05885 [Eggerthellaceae bacterium]|nr:hypothetical protein [Eggerthellaceae bacterium]
MEITIYWIYTFYWICCINDAPSAIFDYMNATAGGIILLLKIIICSFSDGTIIL